MELKVHHQGDLDGLCGIYAIAHAFHLCGLDDTELAFQTACKTLDKTRWPNVLWKGTFFADMKEMISAVSKKAKISGLEISYPFEDNMPRTLDSYFEKLQALFEEDDAVCAIAGFIEPEHWTIIRYEGGRVNFYDSTHGKDLYRKNRSSFAVNKQAAKANDWIPDRSEIVLFSVRG